MADVDLPPARKRDRLKERAWRYVPVPVSVRTSDLPKRVASALVMLAVAGLALWLGGAWLQAFILLVAAATFGEFARLVWRATANPLWRAAALFAGIVYIGLAGLFLTQFPLAIIGGVVGAVIFVDSFAYGFGRTIGGPKIAPSISPSKTWAGLLGGIVGASVWTFGWLRWIGGGGTWEPTVVAIGQLIAVGAIIAVAAQSGDFFESWLKRKAHMKDSSNLIPGHGGVFDRTDGLIPVILLAGFFAIGSA